jgi:hypothetical protein
MSAWPSNPKQQWAIAWPAGMVKTCAGSAQSALAYATSARSARRNIGGFYGKLDTKDSLRLSERRFIYQSVAGIGSACGLSSISGPRRRKQGRGPHRSRRQPTAHARLARAALWNSRLARRASPPRRPNPVVFLVEDVHTQLEQEQISALSPKAGGGGLPEVEAPRSTFVVEAAEAVGADHGVSVVQAIDFTSFPIFGRGCHYT